jgi:hypothetical protein
MDTIYIIPTVADKTPRWTQQVDMSGVRYKLYFSWNTRGETWSISIYDSSGNFLLGGIRLVPYIDLLEKYRARVPALPSGLLRVLDKENDKQTAELTRDSFGERFVLSYTDYSGV